MSRPKMSSTWCLPKDRPHPTEMKFEDLLGLIASAPKAAVDKAMAQEERHKKKRKARKQ